MRKLFLLTVTILLVFFIFGKFRNKNIVLSPIGAPKQLAKSEKDTTRNLHIDKSIFVPYWTLTNSLDTSEYDQVIYFGISPAVSGIDTSDPGYTSLPTFTTTISQRTKKLLALRMLDSQAAFTIIENKQKSERLIQATIETAKTYGFDGIVLDLEVKSLPFESVLQNITNFQKNFYEEAKKNNLLFNFAIYGDTFFRIRPFNVKEVGTYADTVMVMAYDFSKAGGADPGPNFPYEGKEKYGYDFQQMLADYLAVIPPQKLAIIFGFYGYDWEVDNKEKTVMPGESMSLYKINTFLSSCLSCSKKRDSLSKEMQVTYQDTSGKPHTIWYEDTDSVTVKEAYAKGKGITHFSYWAYSYF